MSLPKTQTESVNSPLSSAWIITLIASETEFFNFLLSKVSSPTLPNVSRYPSCPSHLHPTAGASFSQSTPCVTVALASHFKAPPWPSPLDKTPLPLSISFPLVRSFWDTSGIRFLIGCRLRSSLMHYPLSVAIIRLLNYGETSPKRSSLVRGVHLICLCEPSWTSDMRQWCVFLHDGGCDQSMKVTTLPYLST